MLIQDPLYGEHEFTEPVLIELINSAPIQRLKGICQLGLPDKWYFKKNYTRFEHSVGTAILIAKLGASLENQIVGLLHDVGHTAFSHVADFVFGDPVNESLNDTLYYEKISSGEISKILTKYGFSPSKFKNIKDFPIVKRSVPHLCADTIDYCLREFHTNGKDISYFIGKFSISRRKIIMTDQDSAKKYAELFLELNKDAWSSSESTTRYLIMAKLLKFAIKKKIISRHDFNKDDAHVINKLLTSNLPEVKQSLDQLETGNFDIIDYPKKNRWCDPEFLKDGKVLRLSDIDINFAEKIKNISTK